jgi:hypothetical protein
MKFRGKRYPNRMKCPRCGKRVKLMKYRRPRGRGGAKLVLEQHDHPSVREDSLREWCLGSGSDFQTA